LVSCYYLSQRKYAQLNTYEQEKNAQMRTIGERMRLFALAKYSKIYDFADALDMGAPNVQAYMRGARRPGSSVLQKIKKLGCNLDWLLTGEGEMMQREAPVKQPDSDHLTGNRRELTLEEAQERYTEGKNFFMPAIGAKMTPYPITEGEMLIISPTEQPIDGDFVLSSDQEGPIIIRWHPGINPIGVIVHTSKNRETIRKSAGRISQTK
jgi:transcriptional regulator with XRE-family HTH domain